MGIIITFLFKVVEMLLDTFLRILFPGKKKFRDLSKKEKVKFLDSIRFEKGYKQEWLYYRCKEEGLLKQYNRLFKYKLSKIENESLETFDGVRFTFGKYKGRMVKEIWEIDKSYIIWLHEQPGLLDYKKERNLIISLANED